MQAEEKSHLLSSPDPNQELHLMARATDAIITTRVQAARTFSTCSTVDEVHASLISQLAVSRPHSIRYSADARDLEERTEHVQAICNAFVAYLSVIMEDTAHNASGGHLRDAGDD